MQHGQIAEFPVAPSVFKTNVCRERPIERPCNWRGPVWLPMNWLVIESLRRYHTFYGDEFKVECPTGSCSYMTLSEVADELS